jgi:hypothetical protein
MSPPRVQRDYVEEYPPVVHHERPRKEPTFYHDAAQVIIGGFVEVEPLERQAVSIYILALILAPNESPLTVLARILTGGFSPDLTILIPLSSLLLLSIVLASMVGVIYFLVVPEMKNYVSGNGRETIATAERQSRWS